MYFYCSPLTDSCAGLQGAAVYGYGKVSSGGNADNDAMLVSTKKVGLLARPFPKQHVNLTL
jgi:hypothetical protein